jgi:hypothetical protein
LVRTAPHGPWCNSRGFVKRCSDCGRRLYLWTCDHLRGQWLPFESWLNGFVAEGEWAWHRQFCDPETEAQRPSRDDGYGLAGAGRVLTLETRPGRRTVGGRGCSGVVL